MGDHTECVEIDFDPAVVTYETLLDTFFSMHNAARSAHSVQYQSIILHHDDQQAQHARAAVERQAALLGKAVLTRVQAHDGFTRAEDYHQKYGLKGDRKVLKALRRAYPDPQMLTDSTVAARLNGYLYGGGSLVQLEREIGSFGLDSETEDALMRAVGA
jgi:peptide-methionine (S)-S-oxide reductase